MFAKALQPEKAELPMEVTLSGIDTEIMSPMPLNAQVGIVVTPSGIVSSPATLLPFI